MGVTARMRYCQRKVIERQLIADSPADPLEALNRVCSQIRFCVFLRGFSCIVKYDSEARGVSGECIIGIHHLQNSCVFEKSDFQGEFPHVGDFSFCAIV